MLVPVAGAACNLLFEEEPGDISGVRKRNEEQVHLVWLIASGEAEGRQQRDRLAALLEEDGAGVHGLDVCELLGGVGHDDPPQGTCSKNFMPDLTRSLAFGLSGVSCPSSLMTSRT